ncbi:MAG: D-alanyl-D-alanine carboxypeptidase family protein [Ruminococcus sp.]
MEKKKRRKGRLKVKNIFFTLLILGLIIWILCDSCNEKVPADNNMTVQKSVVQQTATSAVTESAIITTTTTVTEPPVKAEYPSLSANALQFDENIITSPYGILIDNSTNEIIAYKNYDAKIYPASLTKIMTLIVAVENVKDFNDTQLITADMIDPMIEQDATRAGFVAGESPTVTDLLYGLILPSGADASIAIAEYVAGSEQAFVDMMNKKCSELGLKSTHFTNCIGLHHPSHYSTVQDMAVILRYAVQNDLCREILSTYQYTTSPSEYNPEGIDLTSTMFQRMSGDEMTGVTVLGGKTGYTDEAGQCLASFAEINGKEYTMVMADNPSKWYVIYDTLSAYSIYGYGGEAYIPPQ